MSRRRSRGSIRLTTTTIRDYGQSVARATANRATTTSRDVSREVPHLTVDERVARGKAARTEAPRSSHAVYEPAPRRPDPVKLLKRQAETRVPELVPIRYGRMLVSPFTSIAARR